MAMYKSLSTHMKEQGTAHKSPKVLESVLYNPSMIKIEGIILTGLPVKVKI